jgi:ubiquitin-like domain-containing CTD phosphatase 1
LASGKKFTLIGTPQGKEHKDPSGELSTWRLNVLTPLLDMDLPDVVNDLDIDFASNPEAAARCRVIGEICGKSRKWLRVRLSIS